MNAYPAETVDQFAGQVFGILTLIFIGLAMYWVIWYLIHKYLLNPLIKKSFRNETIEEDQARQDRKNDQ